MTHTDRQLEVAQQLQRGLIPQAIPRAHSLQIGALSLPAEKVGGDFYDFIPREEGAFDFVLGDATGHGLTAAFVVALTQATFRETVAERQEIGILLDHTDRLLHQRLPRRLFIAANYGHVMPQRQEIHLFNAAQQSLFFDAQMGRCREIEVEGSTYPLGIVGRGGYVPSRLQLKQGDMVVCFSDGLPEALNPRDEMFEFERLKRAIQQAADGEPDEVIGHILHEVDTFTDGREREDDLTLLVAKTDAERRVDPAVGRRAGLVGERRPVALLCMQFLRDDQPVSLPAPVWTRIQEEMGSYGGVADRLAEDTLIACFGLPEIHEDDPERAIMAARIIEDLLGDHGYAHHCGMHIGDIVARIDGSLDYNLMGQTLVETLRLLNEARLGTVYLSAEAFQRLEGRVNLRSVEALYEARSTFVLPALADVRHTHRYSRKARGAYVGRREEFRRLHRTWHRAAERRGEPTVVLVIGEAGIGKSRLVEEFLERKKASGVSHGQAREYAPESAGLFASMLRNWLRVEEGETAEGVRRLEEMVEVSEAYFSKDSFPYLKALLGYRADLPENVDPETYRAGLIRAVCLWIEGLASRPEAEKPLAIVLEDLHWMDSLSREILTSLGRNLRAEGGVLVVGVSRPHEELQEVFSGCRRRTVIELRPLEERDVNRWIFRALEGGRLPEEVAQALREQANGHPLFLEELMLHLQEDGTLFREKREWKLARPVSDWKVPQNLNGLILSRVTRLDEFAHQVLRLASVVGQQIRRDLLEAVQESIGQTDGLEGWIGKLVQEQFLVPTGDGDDFVFRHALIRQVVYDALLVDDRAWLHKHVAQTIEAIFAGQLDQFTMSIAEHYYQARQIEPAFEYLLRSLGQCVERFSVQEGLDLVERGKELAIQLDTSRSMYGVLKYEEEFLGLQGRREDQKDTLSEMEHIAMVLEDDSLLTEVFLRKGRLAYELTLPEEEILAVSRKALQYSRKAGDRSDEGRSLGLIAFTYDRLGKKEAVLEHFQKALVIFQELGDKDQEMRCKGNLAGGYTNIGQYEKALDTRKECIDYDREVGNKRNLVIQLGNQGSLYMFLGLYDDAMAVLEEGYRLSENIGYKWAQTYVLYVMIESWLTMEKFEEAYDRSDELGRLVKEVQNHYGLAEHQIHLARYYGSKEQESSLRRGLKHAQKAIRITQRYPFIRGEIIARTVYAQIAHKMGTSDDVLKLLQKAYVLYIKQSYEEDLFAEILFTQFRVLDFLGRHQEGEKALLEAYEILQKVAGCIKDRSFQRSFWKVPLRHQIQIAAQTILTPENWTTC